MNRPSSLSRARLVDPHLRILANAEALAVADKLAAGADTTAR
jgi:hypothetical protein